MELLTMSSPRYPNVRVAMPSDNPWAVASAVRQALRRAGAAPEEIQAFSDEALAVRDRPGELERRCRDWVRLT